MARFSDLSFDELKVINLGEIRRMNNVAVHTNDERINRIKDLNNALVYNGVNCAWSNIMTLKFSMLGFTSNHNFNNGIIFLKREFPDEYIHVTINLEKIENGLVKSRNTDMMINILLFSENQLHELNLDVILATDGIVKLTGMFNVEAKSHDELKFDRSEFESKFPGVNKSSAALSELISSLQRFFGRIDFPQDTDPIWKYKLHMINTLITEHVNLYNNSFSEIQRARFLSIYDNINTVLQYVCPDKSYINKTSAEHFYDDVHIEVRQIVNFAGILRLPNYTDIKVVLRVGEISADIQLHVVWNHIVANIRLDSGIFASADIMDIDSFNNIIEQIDQGKEVVPDHDEFSNMFIVMKVVLAATMG